MHTFLTILLYAFAGLFVYAGLARLSAGNSAGAARWYRVAMIAFAGCAALVLLIAASK